MIEVSTREFRNRQGYYLDKVGEGEEVLIRRRNRKSCRVVPEADDDTLMSKEELDAIIKQGLENIKNGKGKRYTMEELRVKMGL
jgi:prevent-host-death family protein